MPVSDGFREYVLEQLGRVRPVHPRSMFGALGVYADGLFFAIVDDDVVYFKADDVNRGAFEALGLQPFRPYGPDSQASMSYYEIPADALEDPDELAGWVESAVAAALRGKEKKRPKPPKQPRQSKPPKRAKD